MNITDKTQEGIAASQLSRVMCQFWRKIKRPEYTIKYVLKTGYFKQLGKSYWHIGIYKKGDHLVMAEIVKLTNTIYNYYDMISHKSQSLSKLEIARLEKMSAKTGT